MNEISDILLECGRMRGIGADLFHRTLREFDWFVTELVFRNGHSLRKYRKMVFPLDVDADNIPRKYALAFREYCRDVYEPKGAEE